MSTPKVTIRESLPDDRAAIIDLLRERDERSHNTADVERALFRMDPALFRAWMAFDGVRPVGITALYIRDVLWQGAAKKAGYWSHLYVNPDYRKIMLYPNLVLTMMRSSKGIGLGGGAPMDFLYTGTRRPEVAEAHVRIGFGLCGFITVRFKPLRPARLIAKHKNLGKAVAVAAAPVDAVYSGLLALTRPRVQQGLVIEESNLESDDCESLASMLNTAGGPRFGQIWTPTRLRQRFAGAIDGHSYTLLVARSGGRAVGAIVFRMAERGAGIRVGVVMDFVDATADGVAARPLLAEAESRAARAGAEVMLALDGVGEHDSRILAGLGYRNSSEKYQMTAWPKDVCPPGSWGANLANWRFGFSDHDAF